jgi:hypothetical protein
LTASESKSTLRKKWKQWKRLSRTSYGVPYNEFPKIIFSNKKRGREDDHAAFSKESIQEACKTLHDNGKSTDALLLHIMFA